MMRAILRVVIGVIGTIALVLGSLCFLGFLIGVAANLSGQPAVEGMGTFGISAMALFALFMLAHGVRLIDQLVDQAEAKPRPTAAPPNLRQPAPLEFEPERIPKPTRPRPPAGAQSSAGRAAVTMPPEQIRAIAEEDLRKFRDANR